MNAIEELRQVAESMKHSAGTYMIPGYDGWKIAALIESALAARAASAAIPAEIDAAMVMRAAEALKLDPVPGWLYRYCAVLNTMLSAAPAAAVGGEKPMTNALRTSHPLADGLCTHNVPMREYCSACASVALPAAPTTSNSKE